jgi:hypothetical protein
LEGNIGGNSGNLRIKRPAIGGTDGAGNGKPISPIFGDWPILL